MEIKTKYNLGDKFFALNKEGKIKEMEVKKIVTFVNDDGVRVTYDYVDSGLFDPPIEEDKCFESREAIIAYMTSEL